jgi:hypothetical protein
MIMIFMVFGFGFDVGSLLSWKVEMRTGSVLGCL